MEVSDLVRAELLKRLSPEDTLRALDLLTETELPLLVGARFARDRSRVHLAVLILSGGNMQRFEEALAQAAVDWRDVLVAAGLAHLDWPRVLEAAGYPVP